jgi:hypothetical protein
MGVLKSESVSRHIYQIFFIFIAYINGRHFLSKIVIDKLHADLHSISLSNATLYNLSTSVHDQKYT